MWNIAVVNSTIQIIVVEKHDVQNIVVPNMPVGNESGKNKMAIQNNVHGSYFIWMKNKGVGDIRVSMRVEVRYEIGEKNKMRDSRMGEIGDQK